MGRSDEEDRKLAKLREDVRRLRDSVSDFDEEERSSVTVNLVHPPKSARPASVPAPAKPIVAVLAVIPPGHRVLIVLALIAASVYTGKALGWF